MVRQLTIAIGIVAFLLFNAPVVGERDRRDVSALGIIRSVQRAQAMMFSVAGHYETLQCLASSSCVAELGFSSGGLLDPHIATLKNHFNYRLLFYLGPRSSAPGKTLAATPLTAYAMVAIPETLTEKTPRAYCGDSSGAIFAIPDGRFPRVEDGRCLDRAQRID